MKSGQVAHLDRDATNNSPGNLAFLCLEHHDLYDSTTRQSKNITKGEVIVYRDELLKALHEAFSSQLLFGSAATAPDRRAKMIDGYYIRITDGDGSYQSAEIKISRIASKHSQYHVSGHALWGKKRLSGPHIGDFDFIMTLDGGAFRHVNSQRAGEAHSIYIKIDGQKLIVEEENWLGAYGMNVNFIGEYQKSD